MTLKELSKQLKPGYVYAFETKEQIGEYPLYWGRCWILPDGVIEYGRLVHDNDGEPPIPLHGFFKTDKDLEQYEMRTTRGSFYKTVLDRYNQEKKKLEAGEPLDR